MSQDRAGVVATAIVHIVTESLRAWMRAAPSSLSTVRQEIERYLRDEFDDCAREARKEHTITDD